jgi:hypothetical protein
MQLAKAAVAVLGIVALSYVTVTSIEHSLGSRGDSAPLVGVDAPSVVAAPSGGTGGTASVTAPCSTLPDLTCAPGSYSSAAPQADEQSPTF